jgi:hypothetical protein
VPLRWFWNVVCRLVLGLHMGYRSARKKNFLGGSREKDGRVAEGEMRRAWHVRKPKSLIGIISAPLVVTQSHGPHLLTRAPIFAMSR